MVLSDPLQDKLNYKDVEECPPDIYSVWEDMLETDNRERYKMDAEILFAAVRTGLLFLY